MSIEQLDAKIKEAKARLELEQFIKIEVEKGIAEIKTGIVNRVASISLFFFMITVLLVASLEVLR